MSEVGEGHVRSWHGASLSCEAAVTRIYEGTSEIQREIIAKALLRGSGAA